MKQPKQKFFALLLALLLAWPLAACAAAPAEQTSSPSQKPETPPASAPQEEQVQPGGQLRCLFMEPTPAATEDGFFTLVGEVMPEKSENGNFYYGYRLYFHDYATRQSRPLEVPGTEGGYLADDSSQQPGFILTAQDRLIVLCGNRIESMNYDLTDRTTLYTFEDGGTFGQLLTDDRYLYIEWHIVGRNIGDPVPIGRLDLTSGEYEDFFELENERMLAGVYQDKMILSELEFPEADELVKEIRYYTFDPATKETAEMYTVDSGGRGLTECMPAGGRFFWQNSGENFMNMYDPDTGETTALEFSENPYFYYTMTVWDNKLPVRARKADMSGYDYFYVDLETKETAPLDFRVQRDYTDYLELIEIAGEYQDWYIVAADGVNGTTWAMNEAGKPEILDIPAGANIYDYTLAPASTDYVVQYALVNKEDYWQGKVDYIPFTIMPLPGAASQSQ